MAGHRSLRELLQLDGVVVTARWCHRPGDVLELTHPVTILGAVKRDVGWWLMNFCDWNARLCQAQTLEYENRSGYRNLFPPRFTLVRGRKYSFIGTSNRVMCVLENARRPNILEVAQRMEAIAEGEAEA